MESEDSSASLGRAGTSRRSSSLTHNDQQPFHADGRLGISVSETTEVLVAPGGPSLTDKTYGKEYYMLDSVARAAEDLHFDAYFHRVSVPVPRPNVDSHEVGSRTTTGFYLRCFETARRRLAAGDVDLYKHMGLSYRSFNPVILAGLAEDTPSVVGPAQPPHGVPRESFQNFARKTTGIDWPEPLLNAVYPGVRALQENGVDRLRERLFAATLRRVDRVVVVNEETADIYEQHVPRSKIDVVPYGVAVDRFRAGMDRRPRDVVAVGTLTERKGYDVLIASWPTVVSAFPDAQLHVYGRGPRRDTLVEKVEGLGVSESVRFHGWVDHSEVSERLATAGAFVHPSLSEGFPHVRLEAMASACPVVVSDVIGTHEMVRHRTDGLVVPTGSADALAEALCDLLADPDRAREMGLNARSHVESHFDWDDIGRRYLDIYQSLL